MNEDFKFTLSIEGSLEQIARVINLMHGEPGLSVSVREPDGKLSGGIEKSHPTGQAKFDLLRETERFWREIRSVNARRIIYEIAKHPESEGGIGADDLWEAVGVGKRKGPGMLSSAGLAHQRIKSPIETWIGWNPTTRTYRMPDDIASIYRQLGERDSLDDYVIPA